MDADGSISSDDSIPLIFSEMCLTRDSMMRVHLRGHFPGCPRRA